jgi:hypothetical protein
MQSRSVRNWPASTPRAAPPWPARHELLLHAGQEVARAVPHDSSSSTAAAWNTQPPGVPGH